MGKGCLFILTRRLTHKKGIGFATGECQASYPTSPSGPSVRQYTRTDPLCRADEPLPLAVFASPIPVAADQRLESRLSPQLRGTMCLAKHLRPAKFRSASPRDNTFVRAPRRSPPVFMGMSTAGTPPSTSTRNDGPCGSMIASIERTPQQQEPMQVSLMDMCGRRYIGAHIGRTQLSPRLAVTYADIDTVSSWCRKCQAGRDVRTIAPQRPTAPGVEGSCM